MKWHKFSTLAAVILFASTAWAGHDHAQKQSDSNDHKDLQVTLYQKPKQSSKAIEHIKLNQMDHYVPFHSHGDWVKVGDSDSGQVGWINKKSYHKLLNKASQPEVHTHYVYSTEKNGKPEIYAFENGKKLSKKKAQKLYHHMQEQMKAEQQHFKQHWKQFNKQFQQLNNEFAKMFNDDLASFGS